MLARSFGGMEAMGGIAVAGPRIRAEPVTRGAQAQVMRQHFACGAVLQ